MGCAELVDALEMRLQGQHTGPEQEALDAHLPGCADCRAYLEVAARVEQQLAQRALAPPPAQLEAARSKALAQARTLRGQDRMVRNYLLLSVVGIPAFERLCGGPWAGPDALDRLGAAFGSALLMGVVLGAVRYSFRRAVEALELARDDGELIAVYRQQLDAKIHQQRHMKLGFVVMGLFYVCCAVGSYLDGERLLGAMALVLAGQLVWLWPKARGRQLELRREREALQ
jgi:anti-sigma factor RsiW